MSILDIAGSVLIVPQATLGGRLKGKMMQYHGNIDKAVGQELYTKFVQQCQNMVAENSKCQEARAVVQWGTYGNRQVLSMDTNGPFTHLVEF